MVEISGSSIKQIFNAGVELVKTIQEKGVSEGFQQVGSKFLDLCKTVSTSMSNSFSSISRNVKQSLESFFPKFSIASSEQKQMELPTNKTENTEKAKNSQAVNQSSHPKTGDRLINGVIDELEKMGCPKGKIYVMRNGVTEKGFLKESFHHFDLNEKDKQRNYIRNVLVQMKLDRNEIDTTTYNKLKTESLENVLEYLEMVPQMTKAEYCEDILKEIQTLPKNILSGATTAFYEKLKESQPTLEQFQMFYNKLSMIKNDVTTMEIFNSMLKSFDGK